MISVSGKVREYAAQEQRMQQDLRRSKVPPECIATVSCMVVSSFLSELAQR